MSENKSTELLKINQKLGDIICQRYEVFQDLTVVWDAKGHCHAFNTSSLPKNPVTYTVGNEEVLTVCMPDDHDLIVLSTASNHYFRNHANEEITDTEDWVDFYYEPFHHHFYRKDKHHNWYNLEGSRLGKPVFLQGNVLVSLVGKKSIKSMVFENESVVCSPRFGLIQIGKIVYSQELKVVTYQGERVTELMNECVHFSAEDNIQMVKIGISKIGFIHEQKKTPYLINGELITGFAGKEEFFSKYNFKVFTSEHNTYFVSNSSDNVFDLDAKPASIVKGTNRKIGERELLATANEGGYYYIDLHSKKPFTLAGFPDENIKYISEQYVQIGGEILYNVETQKRKMVYSLTKDAPFRVGGINEVPEDVHLVKGFESYYFYACTAGVNKLCYINTVSIVNVGDHNFKIREIEGDHDLLLINAVGTNGEHFVLDARNGFDQLSLAMCEGKRLVKAHVPSVSIAQYVLQKVDIQNIGGHESRIVNLNVPELKLFRLPTDLSEYPEQTEASLFANNVVSDIDFEAPIEIEGHMFFQGTFINYLGQFHPVILLANSARPLQLLSLGHRQELVSQIDPVTIQKEYRLGEHRMIGATTLTEDMKEKQLLFSLHDMSSWLTFFDTHLPVFRKIIEIKGLEDWEYILFESREDTNEKEYIAVEKVSPHRILVEKRAGKQQVKIIKAEYMSLKQPEQVSMIKQFFRLDPGYLVDLD